MGLNNGMPYSNGNNGHNIGMGSSGIADPAPNVKDWQEGLRALFPNANISMSSGSVSASSGSANSRLGTYPPGLSSLSQQPGHLQSHQLPLQASSLGAKSWRSSVSDWTSIDPAIVSSGQITDSRSDSPPHWLRSLEQLTETGSNSNQLPPSNSSNIFGLPNSTHYNMPSVTGRTPMSSVSGMDGMNSMGSFWPPAVSHSTPSMPPPGFSHIRPTPKTTATADSHKIDSKSTCT